MSDSKLDAGLGYPFAVVPTATGYSASSLQYPSLAAAESRSELLERLTEQVALYLLDCEAEGVTPAIPKSHPELDLGDYRTEGIEPEIIYVEPAPVNPVSIAIQRAMQEEGVSQAELARRMSTPRSVVCRLSDPFYFGHSSRSLRAVAEVLGRELRIELVKPERRSPGTRHQYPSQSRQS